MSTLPRTAMLAAWPLSPKPVTSVAACTGTFCMASATGLFEVIIPLIASLIAAAVSEAINGMITSNKPVAEAMQKVPVHAATDVTGFGLKGHAANMAVLGKVDIVIDQLAVIRGTPLLSEIFGYPLLQGEAKETAGGML